MVPVICMKRCLVEENNFRWPKKEDVLEYPLVDLLCAIDPPFLNGNFCRDDPVFSFSAESIENIKIAFAQYLEE